MLFEVTGGCARGLVTCSHALANEIWGDIPSRWCVVGPGHRWPVVLKPLYALFERLPPTRAGALRLGLVTLNQMVRALVAAVESPALGITISEVPDIREGGV